MTHVTSGTVLMWISQWEYQCCGEPIQLGDIVDLTVKETDWTAPWTQAMGGERIAWSATHHDVAIAGWDVRVQVEGLWEARARHELHADDGALHPVPDSGEVTPITEMKVWDEDWQPARHGGEPAGWILRAAILGELPPRRDGIPYGIDLSPRLVRDDDEAVRLDEWSAELALGPEPGPDEGWEWKTPFLGAWQRELPPAGSNPELVHGHPCIVVWADTKVCIALYVTREGLHSPIGVGDSEDFVRLSPSAFLGRTRRLLDSDRPGVLGFTPAGSLEDYAALFPEGVPPRISQRMVRDSPFQL